MPWTYDEYVEVYKQFSNLAAIPNYPGAYIISRYTEFAFLAAYNDDADPKTELLSYINTINKEITRKREEFNLETLEIGMTLAEKRSNQVLDAFEVLQTYGNSYEALIKAAKTAIVNERINECYECSEDFMEVLKSQHDGSMMTLTKVSGATMEVPTYYINVTKQTAEPKNGGYKIEDLNEKQLVYFIGECLRNAADALLSYQ
jgi:hypothetical protein